MKPSADKVLPRAEAKAACERLRGEGRRVVFTNGCFDLLHAGHVAYLEFARAQGDALVVGVNSDASVRGNKGERRPVVPQDDRARVIAALACVDHVVIFEEPEPAALVRELTPDVLVKGEDWAHYVSGRDWVEAHGGRVVLAKLEPGRSSSGLVERVLDAYRETP